MNRLDQFLNVAARQMRLMPSTLRDDELRELRGHLEQRVEDGIEQGMTADAAQLWALQALGSPRRLGAQLCDAWEGIAWSWWRLTAAIAGVTAFLMCAGLALIMAFSIVPTNAEIALFPEASPVLCGLYIALPLLCGSLFSLWLGRRGCIVATLYFGTLVLVNFRVTFPEPSQALEAPPALFVHIANATWFPYFWVALAFIGARIGQSWRTQKRALATAGAHTVEGKRLIRMRFNLQLWRGALLLIVLACALYPLRVRHALHPREPMAILRNTLLTAGPQGFDAPESLQLSELPPISEAERAGRERRIHFSLVARAKPYFAANQIKYLRNQRAAEARTKDGVSPSTELALANVKRNHQIIEGTIKMVKTPNGWQRDEKSYDISRLWAWFYGL